MAEFIRGVVAATATPVDEHFEPDTHRLIAHIKFLLENGCDGINLLGTTGEAASFSSAQRLKIMKAVKDSGLPMSRMMVGTGVSSLVETLELTRAAGDLGFNGALVVPPFYYTGIDHQGLTQYVDHLLKMLGHIKLPIYLYHIPQNTGLPWPIEVVSDLARRYVGKVVGIKDSAGDIEYSKAIVKAIPQFQVFPSSEATLSSANEEGFAGCISATTNITSQDSQIAWSKQGTQDGISAGKRATEHRVILGKDSLIPSVKATLSIIHSDPGWARTHPPMSPRTPDQASILQNNLAKAGFLFQS